MFLSSMKKLYIISIILISVLSGVPNTIYGQEKKDSADYSNNHSRHSVYLELLGSGLFYSIGYEHKFIVRKKYELTSTIGISNDFIFPYPNFYFPISINNKFSFLRFNGLNTGLTLFNQVNFWAIVDQDKYFSCPLGRCQDPYNFSLGPHLGWLFHIKRLSIEPRMYFFLAKDTQNNEIDHGFWFGISFNYNLKDKL